MNLVKKTIELSVTVAVEVDEDLIGTDGVDDPFDMADNICFALEELDKSGDLFRGGKVIEYSAYVLGIQE